MGFSAGENPNQATRDRIGTIKENGKSSNGNDDSNEQKNGSYEKLKKKINFFKEKRKRKNIIPKVITTIKRLNKLVQALHLPSIANINPRSIYNKVDEFCTFVN